MKRVLFVVGWLFLHLISLGAEKDTMTKEYRDSIVRVIGQLPRDSVRLRFLREAAYRHQYPPLDYFFAMRLYEESLFQENRFYENQGAYYLASCYDKKHDPDSLSYWVNKLEDLAPQIGSWDYYLEQKAAISRALASKRKIAKAVYIAKEVLEESRAKGCRNGEIAAYNSLGCAYAVSSRFDEALTVLLTAYERFTPDTKTSLRVDVLSRIAGIYGNSGLDSLKIPYMEEMGRILQETIEREPEAKNNWTNMIIDWEVKYIMHFLNRREFPQAKIHIERARALLDTHVDPVFWLNVQLVQLQYYSRIREYDKSIALIDEVTPIVLENYVSTFGVLINYKSITQQEKGDLNGAIATRRYLIRTQDSLNNAFSASQLQQVKEIYHIDELLLEKQKISNTNLIRVLSILALISVLILLFYGYTRYLSRKIVQAEKAAAEAAVRMEAENRAKERLRTEISHDVRTPLNAVVGFAELMTDSGQNLDKKNKEEYSRIIQESAGQLLEYVNHILELSRLESGKIKYEETSCEFIQLCREAVSKASRIENNTVRAFLQTGIQMQVVRTDETSLLALLGSLLTGISEKKPVTRETILRVDLNEEGTCLVVQAVNTPLAEPASGNKMTLIRNEINTHLVRYFGGSYKIYSQTEEGPTIVFTYPVL